MKKYKEKFKELTKVGEIEKLDISMIYLIPSTMYNGFWGKNGFRSYDFIVGNARKKEIYGWFHWEGDVIHLENNICYGMNVETEKDGFIKLWNDTGFEIEGLIISDLVIKAKERRANKNDEFQ